MVTFDPKEMLGIVDFEVIRLLQNKTRCLTTKP